MRLLNMELKLAEPNEPAGCASRDRSPPIGADGFSLLGPEVRELPHQVRGREHRVHLARIAQSIEEREVLAIADQATQTGIRSLFGDSVGAVARSALSLDHAPLNQAVQ